MKKNRFQTQILIRRPFKGNLTSVQWSEHQIELKIRLLQMENLINLDVEIKVPPKPRTPPKKPLQLLVPTRVGVASDSQAETVVHLSDPKMNENPFDFLLLCGDTKKTNSAEELIDGSL